MTSFEAALRERKRLAQWPTRLFDLISCSLCSAPFDDDMHAPRALLCEHCFCSACIASRFQQCPLGWNFECPVDGCVVNVPRKDASCLARNRALLDLIAERQIFEGSLPFRISLKILGGDMLPLVVSTCDAVIEIKQRVCLVYPHLNFKVRSLNMAILQQDGEHCMLLDRTQLCSYSSITDNSTVALMVTDVFGGAEFNKSYRISDGSKPFAPTAICNLVSAIPHDPNSSKPPASRADLCVSGLDGRFSVSSAADDDGKLWQTIDREKRGTAFECQSTPDRLVSPVSICTSPDGQLIYAPDFKHCWIQIFKACDGLLVRTIGSKGDGPGELHGPTAICVSPDGLQLYVADRQNRRVQALNSWDGSHIRSFGAGIFQAPTGVCISSDGLTLFASHLDQESTDDDGHILVFSCSDGQHLRSIGVHALEQDSGSSKFRFAYHYAFKLARPQSVCLSSDDRWIFVSDSFYNSVLVFQASTGRYEDTIILEASMGGYGAPGLTGRGICASADRLFITDLESCSVLEYKF